MTKLSLNFYQDPGHSWVKIHKNWLGLLDIADKISNYSYMRKNYAYLEEDCDLSILFEAAKPLDIEIKLREYHTNKGSKIRSYDNYSYKNPDTVEGFTQYLKDNNKIEFITIGV
jgi:hypothetical protein